jgi:hypothetical protein
MSNSIKNIFKAPLFVFTFLACMAIIYIVPAVILSIVTFDLSKYVSLTQHPTYAAIFGIISFTITLVAVALNVDDK